MAQEPRLAASAPPGSQALLDTLLQNLYDFGECRASEPTWRANLRTRDLAGLSFQAKDSCSSSTPRLLNQVLIMGPAPSPRLRPGSVSLSMNQMSQLVPECGGQPACLSKALTLSDLTRRCAQDLRLWKWHPFSLPTSGKPLSPTHPPDPPDRRALVTPCRVGTSSFGDFREWFHMKLFTTFQP